MQGKYFYPICLSRSGRSARQLSGLFAPCSQPGVGVGSQGTMSDSFTTHEGRRPSLLSMDIRLTSTVLQIFAADVQRSLDFYRLHGLPIPESNDSHVAVDRPGGNTLSFDIEDTIASMHPG